MDIVERLRSDAEDIALLKIVETDKIRQKYRIYGTVVEAADEIERLRKRVELLEGYLNGALNVIEGFVHCDTTEARKALGEKE